MSQADVNARMRVLLDGLCYDFRDFTLEGFAEWLAQQRGRKIAFVPRAMPPKVFGACVKGNGVDASVLKRIEASAIIFGAEAKGSDTDVIFYEIDTPVVHRAHIQLHELSHLICGHPTVEIGSQQIQALLRSVGPMAPADLEFLLLRSIHSDEAEEEAETLTNLIQDRVLRHAKLEELYKAISAVCRSCRDKGSGCATG